MKHLIYSAALLLVLTACGGSETSTDEEDTTASDTNTSETENENDETPDEIARLVESGFGQNGDYTQGIVIVESLDEAVLGEFVEVSVNFLDASGDIIATESQTESFNWVGQELVLPVWLDTSDRGRVEVDSIDASFTISEHGMHGEELEPLEQVEAETVREGQYGDTTAEFLLTNDTDETWQGLRLGIVCRDADDTIIGGTSEYPSAIPAGGTSKVEANVTVSEEPETCSLYPNYDV